MAIGNRGLQLAGVQSTVGLQMLQRIEARSEAAAAAPPPIHAWLRKSAKETLAAKAVTHLRDSPSTPVAAAARKALMGNRPPSASAAASAAPAPMRVDSESASITPAGSGGGVVPMRVDSGV